MIVQDFWFIGTLAPDNQIQWSEIGQQSCYNGANPNCNPTISCNPGGQYWILYTNVWKSSCGCHVSGYINRISVDTELFHKYEIRTNGNTQTFQIDSTQLWTGPGYGNTYFNYQTGTELHAGVEVNVLETANVYPIAARDVSNMRYIPGWCNCINTYYLWTASAGHPGECNNASAPNPDACLNATPLQGKALSGLQYRYWGN
jgi:hypothetical protein